jgi:hypothetical protein
MRPGCGKKPELERSRAMISVLTHKYMMQQPLFNQTPESETTMKKPRLTGKAKREAWQAIMNQIRSGWEPPEAVWTLVAWLSVDLSKSKQSG